LGGVYSVVIGVIWVTAGQAAADKLPFVPFYAIAITIGCLGLFLGSDTLGPNTRAGTAVAFGGMAAASLGIVLMGLDLDIGWPLWFLGGQIIHPMGLILFGLALKNLSVFWRVLPIAVGVLTIFLSLVTSQYELQSLFGVFMVLFGGGWILLGQMPSLARAEVRV